MERYEKYKDSGVEWIGEIPEGWEVAKFNSACETSLGKMLTNKPGTEESFLAPYLKAANIQEAGISFDSVSEMYFDSGDETRYGIVEGDLLVVEGGNVGLAQLWDASIPNCFIQNALHRVRAAAGFDARFLKYCLGNAKSTGYIDLVCNKATIAHFTKDKLLSTPLAVPTFKEQQAIADYLDKKTAEIDGLVADCEREVELLQEYRKAVVSEAVTKGLVPKAPMKDSGIEWIGQIPEMWETGKLSGVTSLITNGYVGPTRNLFVDEGVRYIQSLHVVEGKLDFEKHPYFVTEEWNSKHSRSVLAEGDVLVVQTGAIGNSAYVDASYAGCNCHALIILRPNVNQIDGRYLFFYLFSDIGKEKMLLTRTGATHPHLNSTKVCFTDVLVPPLEEQRAIVAYLDTKTVEIDSLIEAKQVLADKLREYRKSLISEAVTGKFKVPGV